LTCSETQGPFSPLRGGAANEIFVIPIPHRLTFNTAMLLAAGFCIPVRDLPVPSKSHAADLEYTGTITTPCHQMYADTTLTFRLS
jgi:hypothetical protein